MADNDRDSFSSRLFAAIIDYPRSGLFLLVVLTALAIAGYYRPSWPKELYGAAFAPIGSASKGEPGAAGNKREAARSATVPRASLGRADAIVVVQSDQIFSRDGAIAIREVVEALEQLETVASVTWLDQTPPLNIFGLPEPILPRGQASPQRFAA